MLLELLLFISLGIFVGIFTGLTPGIHINLVSVCVVSLSPFLLNHVNVFSLVIFIIAMSITHSFLDFIPSVFLGVPDAETALSILPAHKMVLLGQGFEAVKLTVIGSLLAVVLCIFLIPLLIFSIPIIYELLKSWIGWILVVVVIFMIFKESSWNKKFWSFFVFFASGIIGIVVLNFPNLDEPLLPMLSGLFGLCMLFNSLSENTSIPIQRITEHANVDKKTFMKSLGAGAFAGSLTGFFPGLGASQASIIGSLIVGGMQKIGTQGYLVLLGSISTMNFLLSIFALYSIDKARNGAVVAIMDLFPKVSFLELLIILACVLVSSGVSAYLAMFFGRIFSRSISKINYKAVSWCIIVLIVAMVCFLSGIIGLLVLFTCTMLGFVSLKLGIGKNHAMGCLLLPVIIYFVL